MTGSMANMANNDNLLYILDSCGEKRKRALNTKFWKQYEKALKYCSKRIENFQKMNDYNALFESEFCFKKFDYEFMATDKDGVAQCYNSLMALKSRFENFQNHDVVKKELSPSQKDLHSQNTTDKLFNTEIDSQRRFLTKLCCQASTPAEKDFYRLRRDALMVIKREHQKNIDKAFGKTKEKTKGMGLELSLGSRSR